MPSVSAVETRARLSVATVAALSAFDDTPLASGDLAFVSVDDINGVYYSLLEKSVAVVDGLSVLATKSGVGRWVLTAFVLGAQSTVPNYAALAALVNPALPFQGGQVFVESTKSLWISDEDSTATPNNATVIARVGGGNWLREPNFAHPSWTEQANYWVDALTGDDENAGTALAPLESLDEVARRLVRLSSVVANYTIRLLSDIPGTQNFHFPSLVDVGGTLASVIILGERTVRYSGTFAAVTPAVPGTNTPDSVDGGVGFVAATHIARMVVVTSGAALGSTAWIIKDLTGQLARLGPWSTTQPLAGDTFDVVTLTNFAGMLQDVAPGMPNSLILTDLRIVPDRELGQDKVLNGFCDALFCKVERQLTGGEFYGQMSYFGCLIDMSGEDGVFDASLGINRFDETAFMNTFLVSNLNLSHVLLNDVALQASNIQCPYQSAIPIASGNASGSMTVVSQGDSSFTGLGIFDAPAAPVIWLDRGQTMTVLSALWGANAAASIALKIKGGATLRILDPIVPTLSAIALIEMSEAEKIPEITAGTGVPAAGAAITTWAQWDGAGYVRDAMNLRDGTRICGID